MVRKVLENYFSGEEVEKLCRCLDCGIPIVIRGVQKPTGKSYLCSQLRKMGYLVAEEWELSEKSELNEMKRKFIKNDGNVFCITITLNKSITVRGAKALGTTCEELVAE